MWPPTASYDIMSETKTTGANAKKEEHEKLSDEVEKLFQEILEAGRKLYDLAIKK